MNDDILRSMRIMEAANKEDAVVLSESTATRNLRSAKMGTLSHAIREAEEELNELDNEKVYRNKGSYGTSYDGDEKKAATPAVKRGRGRPAKGSDNSGEVKKYDFSAFTTPAPVGKYSGGVTKHKMVGERVSTIKHVQALVTEALVLEKSMTKAQRLLREQIVKSMNRKVFEKRYGSNAGHVMMATATKQAVRESNSPLLVATETAFCKISEMFGQDSVQEQAAVSELSIETATALANGSVDLHDALVDGKGLRDGEQEFLTAMYDQVAVDRQLHPDDDFEEIYDAMMDQIEMNMSGDSDYPEGMTEGKVKDLSPKHKKMMAGKKSSMYEMKAKPDFIDADGDGDKEEDMVKAIKDKKTSLPESEIETQERPYLCVHAKKGKCDVTAGSSYAAAQKAAKKWGLKSTSGIDAYLTDTPKDTSSLGEGVTEGKVKDLDVDLKDRAMSEVAFKKKYGKTRAEVRSAMKQPVKESMDAGETIDLSPTLLIDLLKLAGLSQAATMTPYAPAAETRPVMMPGQMDMIDIDDTMDYDSILPDEIPMEEEYANSPDEEYADLDDILAQGDDLHRRKGTYPVAAGGDNPMQSTLAETLLAMTTLYK